MSAPGMWCPTCGAKMSSMTSINDTHWRYRCVDLLEHEGERPVIVGAPITPSQRAEGQAAITAARVLCQRR